MMEQESPQVLPVSLGKLLQWNLSGSPPPAVQRRTIVLQPPQELPKPLRKTSAGITSTESLMFQNNEGKGFSLYASRQETEDSTPRKDRSPARELKSPMSSQKAMIANKTKKITKKNLPCPSEKKSSKKVYEISRFFVKNYVGALKSTVYNPNCESDIMRFIGCPKEDIARIRQELDKLLAENPKHNRMQMYKVLTNPLLNHAFQYFLRRKVFSWIFTSSKMQDRYAHLMARKNFLYLCLKAKELTPYNFRIALN